MKKNLLFISLIFLIFIKCGGSADTVTLIPFAGALTSDSRVVLVDGATFSSGNPIGGLRTKFQQSGRVSQFVAFSSNGANIGSCEYGEGMMTLPVVQGIQTSFRMPICIRIDQGDEVCADMVQFVELPYSDPNIDICALLPEGEDCSGARLVRGIASGISTSGSGNLDSAVGMTIEHRYAAVVKGEGRERRALNQLVGFFIIHR